MTILRRVQHFELDAFDVLSAAWVLACNDENPIITYRGLKHRLNLSDDYDLGYLIRSRGDMFRQGVSEIRLEEWKADLRAGRHLPSWIRDINGQSTGIEVIDKLGADDVFRSQFRTQRNAPRSSLEVID